MAASMRTVGRGGRAKIPCVKGSGVCWEAVRHLCADGVPATTAGKRLEEDRQERRRQAERTQQRLTRVGFPSPVRLSRSRSPPQVSPAPPQHQATKPNRLACCGWLESVRSERWSSMAATPLGTRRPSSTCGLGSLRLRSPTSPRPGSSRLERTPA